GWQSVTLDSPVAISANTTYIVSYHTDVGHYASDTNFFLPAGIDHGTLHALGTGVDGTNGVYQYGSAGTFPTVTFRAANYWVDVVCDTGTNDIYAPLITGQTPTPRAIKVSPASVVAITFNEAMQPA